jgi:hypothetical protein
LLWAGVHLLSGAVTLTLLVSVSTPTFDLLKAPLRLVITFSAIVLTVSWAIQTLRAENLVIALASARVDARPDFIGSAEVACGRWCS